MVKAGKRGRPIERTVRAKTIISGQPIGRCFIHLLKVIRQIFVRFQKSFPNRPIEAFIDGVLLRAIRMSIKAGNVFVPRRTGKLALKRRPVCQASDADCS